MLRVWPNSPGIFAALLQQALYRRPSAGLQNNSRCQLASSCWPRGQVAKSQTESSTPLGQNRLHEHIIASLYELGSETLKLPKKPCLCVSQRIICSLSLQTQGNTRARCNGTSLKPACTFCQCWASQLLTPNTGALFGN